MEIRGTGNSRPSALQSSSTAKMVVASLEEPEKAMVGSADQHHRLRKVTVPGMHDPYDRQRQPCQVLAGRVGSWSVTSRDCTILDPVCMEEKPNHIKGDYGGAHG
jgi:hypothetical protein